MRSPRSPRFPGRPCCRPGLAALSGARGWRCAAGPPSCPWLEVSGEGRGAELPPRGALPLRIAPRRCAGREDLGGGAAARGRRVSSPLSIPLSAVLLLAVPCLHSSSPWVVWGGLWAGCAPAPVAGRTCCPRCGAGCAAPGGAVRECRRRGMAPAGPCPSAALPAFLSSAERSISAEDQPGRWDTAAPAKLRAVRGGGGLRGRGGAALRKPEHGRGSIRW